MEVNSTRRTTEERKEILAQHVANLVAQGRRVESQGDFQAVMVRGSKCNHVLHLILTIITFGLWAIVWLVLALSGGEKREIVKIDEWGTPSVTRL